MSDRELLELAAKAAGLPVEGIHERGALVSISKGASAIWWNPLADDGDAFRLATKLRLSLTHHNDFSQPHPWLRIAGPSGLWTHAGPSPEFNADPYAATRRAIVRAAAAMAGTTPATAGKEGK